MDSLQTELLAEIEAFLPGTGMKATTFGKKAVNDGKFVSRLQVGANITVATINRVRAFIQEQKSASVNKNGDAA